MLSIVFCWINTALYLAFSLWCSLRPQETMRFLGQGVDHCSPIIPLP